MSNKRSVNEVQQDYTNLCAKLGHLVYSQHALGLDKDLILEQLKDLNLEGHEAQKREAAEKAALAEGSAS
jgi:regulator of replication initiation timing